MSSLAKSRMYHFDYTLAMDFGRVHQSRESDCYAAEVCQTAAIRDFSVWRPTVLGLNAQVQRLPRSGLSTLNSMAFGLAAGTVRSMVGFAVRITPTPRKTRFQLLVRLYWTGFPPAWFH